MNNSVDEKSQEEFDLALIGKKGIWYDHKVQVLDAVKKN